MLHLTADIHLADRRLKAILNDAERTAKAVNLVYINDQGAGIRRVRTGSSFVYWQGKKKLNSATQLARIKKLAIPPAWEKVWICADENGHLQATGLDQKGRKQYRYHPLWNMLRNQTKFYRLQAFGQSMPCIRRQLEQHLALPGLPQVKVLAALVSLMELTSIRVGNNFYERLYGSFGLTTLKDQHVVVKGHELRFSFKGKKGIMHDISLKSRKLARIVKSCRDIPGKELFQYYDAEGKRHHVDSGMVNSYIKTISGDDFSAKDFRTWAGSVHALSAFRALGCCDTVTAARKNTLAALDSVSKHLGNTRTVCRKYYVHPIIIHLYEQGRLHDHYFSRMDKLISNIPGLEAEEQLLLRILEKESLTIK